MCAQSDINDKMRGILVDWLVEVHLKFKVRPFKAASCCLKPNTLHFYDVKALILEIYMMSPASL